MIEKFQKYHAGDLRVSSVVAAELECGVAKSVSQKKSGALDIFLAPFEILPFDEKSVWAYGELRSYLEKRGEPISSLDTGVQRKSWTPESDFCESLDTGRKRA